MEASTASAPPVAEAPATPGPGPYAALEQFLQPIRRHLAAEITELAINRPGEFWTESTRGWERHVDQDLTYEKLQYLATLCANAAKQKFGRGDPLLSTALPSGERVQLVVPPATSAGCVSITIRKPGATRLSMAQYRESGFFDHAMVEPLGLQDHQRQLKELLARHALPEFFALAVASRQTIVVSGATGSGKTTFMKALADLIDAGERLVTVEDTAELEITQPNHVRLFYAKGGQGTSNVTAGALVEAAMRMKPDRVLLAEVRDESAYYFLEAANTGHPGSITSVHANSESAAFGRLRMLARKAPEAAGMADAALNDLVASTVDIVVQVGKVDGKRAITGIFYDPERRPSLG